MTNTRLNNTLLYMLITAFLLMQWTTLHIHLSGQHSHDGGRHQHNIEAHTHHSIDNHADTIDLAHQSNDIKIVELDHKYNTPKIQKQEKPSFAAILVSIQAFGVPQPEIVIPAFSIITIFSHLDRSTVQLRAPPFFS